MYNDYKPKSPHTEKEEEKIGPFFDAQGNLILDWVGKKAQKFSSDIDSREFKSSALRNFYNEFLRIKNLPSSYNEEKKVLINLLISKAHYKKTTGIVPPLFFNFVQSLIKEVGTDLDKFNKACLVMEAIVGFFPKK